MDFMDAYSFDVYTLSVNLDITKLVVDFLGGLVTDTSVFSNLFKENRCFKSIGKSCPHCFSEIFMIFVPHITFNNTK